MSGNLYGRRDCGVIGCDMNWRHAHTGELVKGERVVLEPHTLTAPAAAYRNARGHVTRALSDKEIHRIKVWLDDEQREIDVDKRDVRRATTWDTPAVMRGSAKPRRRRHAITEKGVVEQELPLFGGDAA